MLVMYNRRLAKTYKFLVFSVLPNVLQPVLVVLPVPLIFYDILSLRNYWFHDIQIERDK